MALSVTTHSGSTAANTVLDLSNTGFYSSFIVTNRSTTASPVELWVRTDGQLATVAGDGCYLVLANTSKAIRNHSVPNEPATGVVGATTVSVISSAICPYYIEFN